MLCWLAIVPGRYHPCIELIKVRKEYDMMDIYAEINKADPAIVERLATALELRAANPRQKQMLNQYLRQI